MNESVKRLSSANSLLEENIAKTTKTLAVELCNEISKDVQANLAKNVKSMDEIQKNAEKT
ncbi:hypothetical protein FACS1894188_13210 [Clostridia bacterium]|nr:hypothetical protein FACS1894188_13210 [Clostridia bacterium]